jgi:nucleotide-binding universal stress UspA family protein
VTGTIIVGYDGQEPAQRALDRAVEEARARHGHLVVVTVAEMTFNP